MPLALANIWLANGEKFMEGSFEILSLFDGCVNAQNEYKKISFSSLFVCQDLPFMEEDSVKALVYQSHEG